MRVMWLSPYLPLPVTTGGRRRVVSLLRRLACRHEIIFLGYHRGENAAQRQAVKDLVSHLYVVSRRSTRHPLNLLRWALGPWPYMAVANGFSGSMVRQLRAAVDLHRPDVIHCEHFHLWQIVRQARMPTWPPVVLSQQGVEFVVTERFAAVPRSPILRLGLRIELAKARRWEVAACREADALIVVSEEDRRLLAPVVPGQQIRVVGNGVDLDTFRPGGAGIDPKHEVMLFVGTFSFFGNRDALRYLVSEILPPVKRRRPSAVLRVIGDDPPQIRADGLEMLGTVDRVEHHLQQARLLIAPLRTGSGTKLKILEAMACGIPFVTTPFGAEGIEGAAEAGLIGDDAAGLAAATVKLLEDPALAQRLGRRGREIAERSCSWEMSSKALERAWEETVRASCQERCPCQP